MLVELEGCLPLLAPLSPSYLAPLSPSYLAPLSPSEPLLNLYRPLCEQQSTKHRLQSLVGDHGASVGEEVGLPKSGKALQ
jgi:hypothetical protein